MARSWPVRTRGGWAARPRLRNRRFSGALRGPPASDNAVTPVGGPSQQSRRATAPAAIVLNLGHQSDPATPADARPRANFREARTTRPACLGPADVEQASDR